MAKTLSTITHAMRIFGMLLIFAVLISETSSRFLQSSDTGTSQYDYSNYNPDFAYDLSSYSLRFEKCQDVKMYDDDLATDENSYSPLAVRHFVVFRLCPSDACSGACDTQYGHYVVDLDTYLAATVDYQQQDFENMCENCQEHCDDADKNCSGCGQLCYQFNNLEILGYIDAAQFIECQTVQQQQVNTQNGRDDGEAATDDGGGRLYIGPRCSAGIIVIGLFSDESCMESVSNVDVEEILGAQLSYHLLAHTSYSDGDVCLSCMENNNGSANANQNDAQDADDVNEMCEDLYSASAKCESKTGIRHGFIQTALDENQYETQVAGEFMSCNFIDQLVWNSYTETGEINAKVSREIVQRILTHKQSVVLIFLSLTISGTLGLITYYQRRINRIEPSTMRLSRGTGVLA
jgi:hypothetical protein